MLYMLDSDISSYAIRQEPKVIRNLLKHSEDTICISAITSMELLFGVAIRKSSKLTAAVNDFLSLVEVVDFDLPAAKECAKIRATLQEDGTPLESMDIMIASCAISAGATLITNNTKHFSRIKGLELDNWT